MSDIALFLLSLEVAVRLLPGLSVKHRDEFFRGAVVLLVDVAGAVDEVERGPAELECGHHGYAGVHFGEGEASHGGRVAVVAFVLGGAALGGEFGVFPFFRPYPLPPRSFDSPLFPAYSPLRDPMPPVRAPTFIY